MVHDNRVGGRGNRTGVPPQFQDNKLPLDRLVSVDPASVHGSVRKVEGWLGDLPPPPEPDAAGRPRYFDPPRLQETESDQKRNDLVRLGETNDGNSVISAGSDSDHESEAGDTLGSEQVFRKRLPLRITMSDAVHRLLNTTSKYDKADIAAALAPFVEACQPVANDFSKKYSLFDWNAGRLKQYPGLEELEGLKGHEGREARRGNNEVRLQMRKLFDQLQQMFDSVAPQYIKPARELVEEGLKMHRGRERLTSHDKQLIAETFGASCLGQMDRQMEAAKTAYKEAFAQTALPGSKLILEIDEDPSSLSAAASIPEGRQALRRTESVASQRPSNASDRTLVQTPSAEPGASGAASSVQSSVVNVRL